MRTPDGAMIRGNLPNVVKKKRGSFHAKPLVALCRDPSVGESLWSERVNRSDGIRNPILQGNDRGYRMTMLRNTFLVAAVVAAAFGTAPARATTYDVNLFLGTSAVQGTIETDGTIGRITDANITSSNLNLYFEGSSVPVALPNVELTLQGFGTDSPLSANQFGLVFDFGQGVFDDTYAKLMFRGDPSGPVANAFFGLFRWEPCEGGVGSGFCLSEEGFDHFFPETQQLTWATIASTVTPTPVPGALPLLVTGFAGLGLVGWRVRRLSA